MNEVDESLMDVAGEFFVELSSCGNPDYGENPDRPMPGVPRKRHPVATLREAASACRSFIVEHGLGGGNWTGGKVTNRASGDCVAQISYNGRVWQVEAPAVVAPARRRGP